MGSGGVGGYFGARLANAGEDVTFVARGAHLAAMREHGLAIEGGTKPLHLPKVVATNDPATIGPVDVVMFCVKLWDTENAAKAIRPIIGPNTVVISFQNGVQKDDMLRPIIGSEPIVGGIAQVATTISRPGTILQTGSMERLVFGEFDGHRSGRVEAFHASCRHAGINAEISDDIQREIWEKFIFLVGMSAVTAAMRLPIGPIRENPRTRAFWLDVMQEVVAVARAADVAVNPDFAAQRLAFIDRLPGDMAASMAHDLARGNRLELEWLSGGVVELGAAKGVPTPMNRAVRDILLLHVQGRA
jgi:2-dehydropantoate 2-reductase